MMSYGRGPQGEAFYSLQHFSRPFLVRPLGWGESFYSQLLFSYVFLKPIRLPPQWPQFLAKIPCKTPPPKKSKAYPHRMVSNMYEVVPDAYKAKSDGISSKAWRRYGARRPGVEAAAADILWRIPQPMVFQCLCPLECHGQRPHRQAVRSSPALQCPGLESFEDFLPVETFQQASRQANELRPSDHCSVFIPVDHFEIYHSIPLNPNPRIPLNNH